MKQNKAALFYTKSIKQKIKGMTLLEVLVALAIFAVAAISVMRAITMHIQTLTYLEEKTFASMVADNQLSKVMLEGVPSSTQKGEENLAGQTWYWQLKQEKTQLELLKAVDIVVATDAGFKQKIVTVRTYVES